ncbi:hypothetical protein Pyrde_0295 [Pyrodictium delaneyi]|uniref:Uncharacterized protein n=1 Tax=Pyrodictium delaneyi TaxID=1273541 RepID=A0A0N7JCU2_9CREN|nr:hypothetical protein Pyrde_0295 [Pyrodictium delaneyi]
MLRVSEMVFIAESLPIARNERQKAHLEFYNLREEIFEALYGEKMISTTSRWRSSGSL